MDALPAAGIGAAVAQLDSLHRHQARFAEDSGWRSRMQWQDEGDAGLRRALRAAALPDQAVSLVRQLPTLHLGQDRLGLDGLRQQPAPAIAQDGCQLIVVQRFGLTKSNDAAIAPYGVSAPSGSSGRLSPASIRRLNHSVVTQIRPWLYVSRDATSKLTIWLTKPRGSNRFLQGHPDTNKRAKVLKSRSTEAMGDNRDQGIGGWGGIRTHGSV